MKIEEKAIADFKKDLCKLLKDYKATIIFKTEDPNLETLSHCKGFGVMFEVPKDGFYFADLTDSYSFDIDEHNII